MKKEPKWLSKISVLAIQEILIVEYSGAPGVLDEGRLESALSSPKNHFAYGKTDLFEMAATYASAIVRDHPFKDGNKRVGLTIAGVFLELNGYRLTAPEEEAVAMTVGLAARKINPEEFAKWLRGNCEKVVEKRHLKKRR